MQAGLFEDNPTPYTSLDDLINDMMKMDDDPLANAGTNVVICRGNPAAKLMIVGEAPGPEENELGKPFVGRSGKLLDQILEAVDFDPEQDVFISNSVFRMPPGEGGKNFRKPTTQEIDAYKPYLTGNHSPRRPQNHIAHRQCAHAIHAGDYRHHQITRTMAGVERPFNSCPSSIPLTCYVIHSAPPAHPNHSPGKTSKKCAANMMNSWQ